MSYMHTRTPTSPKPARVGDLAKGLPHISLAVLRKCGPPVDLSVVARLGLAKPMRVGHQPAMLTLTPA
jgi:hypothetical protein